MPKALPEVALATIQVCNQWKTLRKRNKKDLARTFGGSETSWKHRMYPLITLNFGLNMRNAIKMFHESRDSGMAVRDAAAECWKHYPRIHVVEYEIWESTSENDGARRGLNNPHFLRTKTISRSQLTTGGLLVISTFFDFFC